MSGAAAVVLAIAALPPLVARAAGGRPPGPGPRLAALAPVAALIAIAAMVVAASTDWLLALLLAVPAATLTAWQLPPRRRPHDQASAGTGPQPAPGTGTLTLRVLTLNVQGGSVDPVALVRSLRRLRVDVLAVQELTPRAVRELSDADVAAVLPFCHLDPRPGSPGAGLWARWPLTPLPPVPGLAAAAPRASVDPLGGSPVILCAVHPIAPMKGGERQWQQDLALLRSALAVAAGPQVVAGDFNATRDHRPFRDLLAAGFLDCGDAARSRPWPGFTWPAGPGIPSVMRLDHVLISRAGAAVPQARVVRVPGTDHRGVFAIVEFAAGNIWSLCPEILDQTAPADVGIPSLRTGITGADPSARSAHSASATGLRPGR